MSGYGTAINDTHPRLSDAEMMTNLRKENAKLRKQGERLFNKARELGTENAKLRLLVRSLIRITHPADRAELIANAAELGIEVDG